jgi:hypothetical protein
MRTMNWVNGFFVHKRIISAVKRVEFVSDRMSVAQLVTKLRASDGPSGFITVAPRALSGPEARRRPFLLCGSVQL